MVATLAQAASAAYYLESQRSFRHPNEYYTAGEEPDGVWFNPADVLGLENGGKVDSGDFQRLYNGFSPDDSSKLTRNAGSENRSPGVDMTFSADKSVSTLWAIADPELRGEIEQAHNDAARVALEETVFRYCAYTRVRDEEGRIRVLPADISVAMFQHGTSRENDPQLHTHCVIFNAGPAPARTASGGPCTSTRPTAGPRPRARSTATRSPGTCASASGSAWSSTVPTTGSPESRACRRICRSSGRSGARRSSRRPGSWAFRRSATPRAWPASTS